MSLVSLSLRVHQLVGTASSFSTSTPRVTEDLAPEGAHGLAQLRRMLNPKAAVKRDQKTGHEVQRVRLRAEDHSAARFLERAHIWSDAPPCLGQRQLEGHLDWPAPLNRRQRFKHEIGAIEIERLGEGIGPLLQRLNAIQPEHAHVLAQVAPPDNVPASALMD